MEDEKIFYVYLKSGIVIEAVTSFDIGRYIGDVMVESTIFKAIEDGKYSIVTIEKDNIEFIREAYTEDTWSRFLDVANMQLFEEIETLSQDDPSSYMFG